MTKLERRFYSVQILFFGVDDRASVSGDLILVLYKFRFSLLKK